MSMQQRLIAILKAMHGSYKGKLLLGLYSRAAFFSFIVNIYK